MAVVGILTKSRILDEIRTGALRFAPELDIYQLQPHAIDLRLGFTFLVARHWMLTQEGRIAIPMNELGSSSGQFDVIELEPGQVFDLLPSEAVIVSTLEMMTIPGHLVGHMYPRSSVSRKGLAVDLSGIVDAGYEGRLIIPVRNNNPCNSVRLYPGERFCQLTLTELDQPAEIRLSRYHQRDIATGVLPELDEDETKLIRDGDVAKLKSLHAITNTSH